MILTIHQPEHLPWLGFFHKMMQADIIVLLDNVQFRKNYFQNRNKIRTKNGWGWLTVPVNHTKNTLIRDVNIALDKRWKKKWWNTLFFSYKKTKYFNCFSDEIHSVLNQDWDNLSNLNISLIKLLSKFLKIDRRFISASQLDVEGKGNNFLLDICKKLNADVYLSGISGKEYLKTDDFLKNNIKVKFHEFYHPIYKQLCEPFIPCMSVIDLLFNNGDKSVNIINGVGEPVIKKIFL